MKKFFYFLLALPLLFVACNSGSEETPMPKPEKPSLKLTSASVVEFDVEGGEGTITYTYSGGTVDGNDNINGNINSLKIECEAEWIDVPAETAPIGSFSYTVTKNNTTEAREAVITAKLKSFSFSVTIKQAAGEEGTNIKGWGVIGSMTNSWNLDDIILMEEVEGYFKAAGVALTTNDSFKFIKDGDYAENRGGNGKTSEVNYAYEARLWGSDIRVSEDGRYDIYLNAKLDTYYVMSEGKSPNEALKPTAPGEYAWTIEGNFSGGKASLEKYPRYNYLIAEGVTFSGSEGKFIVYRDDMAIGAKSDDVHQVEDGVALKDESTTEICVAVEAGVKYDIFYRNDLKKAWVMPAGRTPIIWKEVTGVAFSATNYGVFLIAEGMELIFDFNCAPSENSIIPEGRYYVVKEDGSSDFNMEAEYVIRINGEKSFPVSGYMDIAHIKGGYDITVDMVSTHNDIIKVHYAGPIGEVAIMGRPITNPE